MILQSLQVFRGFAAGAVVLHHASVSTDAFVSRVPDIVLRGFDLGALGVDFFSCYLDSSSCTHTRIKRVKRL